MKRLALVAFRATSISGVYKRLKSSGMKWRKRLVIFDDIIIASIEVRRNYIGCHTHDSGIQVIDWTKSWSDESSTQLEIIIDRYKLRIS